MRSAARRSRLEEGRPGGESRSRFSAARRGGPAQPRPAPPAALRGQTHLGPPRSGRAPRRCPARALTWARSATDFLRGAAPRRSDHRQPPARRAAGVQRGAGRGAAEGTAPRRRTPAPAPPAGSRPRPGRSAPRCESSARAGGYVVRSSAPPGVRRLEQNCRWDRAGGAALSNEPRRPPLRCLNPSRCGSARAAAALRSPASLRGPPQTAGGRSWELRVPARRRSSASLGQEVWGERCGSQRRGRSRSALRGLARPGRCS